MPTLRNGILFYIHFFVIRLPGHGLVLWFPSFFLQSSYGGFLHFFSDYAPSGGLEGSLSKQYRALTVLVVWPGWISQHHNQDNPGILIGHTFFWTQPYWNTHYPHLAVQKPLIWNKDLTSKSDERKLMVLTSYQKNLFSRFFCSHDIRPERAKGLHISLISCWAKELHLSKQVGIEVGGGKKTLKTRQAALLLSFHLIQLINHYYVCQTQAGKCYKNLRSIKL